MWGIGLPALVHPFGARIARALNDTAFALRYAPGTGPQTYVFRDPFLDNKLTTDPGMWAFMVDQLAQAPALMLSGPSLRWVTEGILECAALAALPAPDTALGGLERIVDIPAVERQIARWPKARLDRIASAQHEVMMETAATRAHFYDACAALFDANRG
jgi:lysophospholipase